MLHACFFKGKDRGYVTKILDGCEFDATIGISVLVSKHLLKINDDNQLWMHDLLQEMGHQIVKKESSQEPGKRSRLWQEADVRHVLTKNTGTEAVEAIILEKDIQLNASAEAFSRMINLRLLKIHNVKLSRSLDYLSNELCLLQWHGYPLKSLPSNSQLDKTIELEMCCSRIEQLWKETKHLNNLKIITLNHSRYLKKTPNFTWVPNLEQLILEGCTRLCEVHTSLLVHNKIVLLNLRDCKSLATLPKKIDMSSLQKLVLSGCSKLKEFPEIVGNMGCLSELFLDGTAIKGLPLSVEYLTGLIYLNLKDCKNLESLPSVVNGLRSLKNLNLSGCSKLENVPENLGEVESLEKLDISGTAIRQPASSIFFMKNLKELSFRGCKAPPSNSWFLSFPWSLILRRNSDPVALMLPSLSGLCSLTKLDLSDCNLHEGAIPSDFGSLFSLESLILSRNNFVSLPASINRLSELRILILEGCKRLQSLPELPSNLRDVRVDACYSLKSLPDLSKLCSSKCVLLSCINCLKLLDYKNMAVPILRGFIKTISDRRVGFSFIVPGSEIPKLFSHQNQGSSITIKRPPHLLGKSKLVGYAVCSLFIVHEHPPVLSKYDDYGTHDIICHVTADGRFPPISQYTVFEQKFGEAVVDHLWLFYLYPNKYYAVWEETDEYKHVEFYFTSNRGQGLEVKSCGVRPIYEQDVEELNQSMSRCSSSTFRNVNEFHQDLVESMMDVATTKQSLIDYGVSEPSESGCSDEEPQRKRLKLEFS